MLKLSTTFSPMMLGLNVMSTIREVSLVDAKQLLSEGFESIVGHEVTASILTSLLDVKVNFNRQNVTLNKKDHVVAIIPSFRSDVAREFTKEEILKSPVRCFYIINF